jgi:hypothetical protein
MAAITTTTKRTTDGSSRITLRAGLTKQLGRLAGNLLVALLLFSLSACATTAGTSAVGSGAGFERSSVQGAELWIGNRLQVQKECENRGVALYANDTKIYGCTDFARRIIVSVADPKIIEHELCHWTKWTASHEVCPTPAIASR